MPAIAKVTKTMIIDAAFEIARSLGVENINARTVSEKLNCSTQPILYHFTTIDELKRAVYAKADIYHSEFLLKQSKTNYGIGFNYINFAIKEPYLFRFLFQSNYFSGKTLLELIDADELLPILSNMQKAIGASLEDTKKIFSTIFLFAHGYASIIANNSLKYDENLIKTQLETAYKGAILAVLEEKNEKDT